MELNFQQRWEFIRDNGSDSSSNDSKCSSRRQRAFTNVMRIDNTVTDGNDESTDAGRFQKESLKEPITSEKSSPKKQRGRRKRKERQAVYNKKSEGKSGRRSTRKNVGKATSLNSLENYTNSLVEDLKAARQDLVVWMKEQVQEIIGEETATKSERRKCSISAENLQQQNPDMFEQTQAQHQNYLPKNTKAKHHIDTGKCSQVEQLRNSKNNSIVLHPASFVSDIEVHRGKNFQGSNQHLNQCNLLPGPKLQNFYGENMEFCKRKGSAQSSKAIIAQGNQVDYNLAIVPATTSGKLREKTSPSPAKSKIETGPPKHQQKNIVLGIRAQSCNDILPARSSGRKRTASCQSSHPKRDLDQWQALSSILPTEKHHKGIPSLSSDPNFSAYSSSYIASVLQSPPLPLVSMRPLPNAATNAPDPTSFSSFEPTFVPNQTGFDSTTLFSKLLGSTDGNRYFQTVQPRDNPQASPQTGLKDTGFSNQKTAATPAGARNFQAQHYQPVNVNVPHRNQPGFDNLLRQSNNTSMPGLMMMMNGGVASMSGQNCSLSEQYVSNSFLSYPPPDTDGRFMNSQGGFQFHK